ncbi:MAG: hypothetical protein ACO20H_02050 [Bacteriovoracaceae bacterium]
MINYVQIKEVSAMHQGRVMLSKLKYILFISFFVSTSAFSRVHLNRLGVGFSNQLVNDIPAISFKLQKNPVVAIGGVLGYSNSDVGGGYGAGLKLHRIIFDEPFLNFYGSILGALIKQQVSKTESYSGFQFDFSFGSEFTFRGIESLGFSVEFGVSVNKLKDLVIETAGNNFITAGVHFYL